MKTRALIQILVLSTSFAFSQSSFKVVEEPLPYSQWATSYTTDIIGQDENFIVYHWQKFIEDHKGVSYVKSVEKGNVALESEHVEFPILNNEKVTCFTRFTPNRTESGVLMTLWIKQADGTFFSSKNHKDSGQKIKTWLLKFNQSLEKANEKLLHS